MPRVKQKRQSLEAEVAPPTPRENSKKIRPNDSIKNNVKNFTNNIKNTEKANSIRTHKGREQHQSKKIVRKKISKQDVESSRYFSGKSEEENESSTKEKKHKNERLKHNDNATQKLKTERSSTTNQSVELSSAKRLATKNKAKTKQDQNFMKNDSAESSSKLIKAGNKTTKVVRRPDDDMTKTIKKPAKISAPRKRNSDQKSVNNGDQSAKVRKTSKISQSAGKKTQSGNKSNQGKQTKTVPHSSIAAKTSEGRTKSDHPTTSRVQTAPEAASNGGSSDSDSSDSEWEEVEDLSVNKEEVLKSQLPDEPVQITLDDPIDFLHKKRKKKQFDMEAWFKRQMNRYKKELRTDMHKVHLLCLLGHGFHVNRLCSNPLLQARAISMLNKQWADLNSSMCNASHLKKFVDWFRECFSIVSSVKGKSIACSIQESSFSKILERKKVSTIRELVIVLVLVLRGLGFDTRIVFSHQPVSLKEAQSASSKKGCKKEETKINQNEDSSTSENKTSRKSKQSSVTTKSSKRKKKKTSTTSCSENGSEESDFEEEERKFRSPVPEKGKKNRKIVLSSEDSEDSDPAKPGTDQWVEVYLPVKKSWICIDCKNGKIDSTTAIEREATQPLRYVITYDNDNRVKDVTRRYASDWLSGTRKLRVDADWWEATLKPHRRYYDEREEQEDNAMQIKLIKKPLPTSVAAFKNHPLYALKRHLLKFEAIYPSTAVPVGHVRNEPVYARECVRTLHTKDTWTKEGRAVRIGETPYKFVKGRIKRNKPPDGAEQVLELFGEWQTEKYMPRPVYQGKVPRNEYGNVELFQPWMLPAGAVHLKIQGLNRVAKKLDIDCVPAMVGWDFHGGHNHPVFDGFVVCEEYKDILLAAWDEETEILKEREAEKREERVLKNWKKLIKGLVVRERLKKRYDFSQIEEEPEVSDDKRTVSKATDMACSWPQNLQLKQPNTKNKDQVELFPFEKL